MAKYWHYTTRDHLERIIESGEIRVSDHNKTRAKEKSTCWFSSNTVWEPTATKMAGDEFGRVKSLTKEEQYELFGLCRIEVSLEAKLISWKLYKKTSGAKLSIVKALEEAGINQGGRPEHWYCSYRSIPQEFWLTIEEWNGQEWVTVTI